MDEKNPEKNIFRELEDQLQEEGGVSGALQDLSESLQTDDFQEEVDELVKEMVQGPLEDREKIFDLEGDMEDIFVEALNAMGSSEEELKDYFQEKDEKTQSSALGLLMSWDYCLMLMQMVDEDKTTDGYIELFKEIFRKAERRDKDRLEGILSDEVEYQKMLQAFEYSFYSAAAEDKPNKIHLKEKMDGIHQFYEGMQKPLFLFISGVIAIAEEDGRKPKGLGTAKQIVEGSSYDMDRFWEEDARIIRNGLSHTDFYIDDEGLTIYTESGDVYEYSTEEVDQVFGQAVKKVRQLFVAVAVAHREEILSEKDKQELSDIENMAQEP